MRGPSLYGVNRMAWMQSVRRWGVMACVVGGGAIALPRAVAQALPPCSLPATAEYFLLFQGETEAERDRIQNLLPASTDVMVCQYLDAPVVRAGGFTSLENANAWAQYLTEVEGAQTFVARPAAPGEVPPAATPVEPVEPSTEPVAVPVDDAVVGYAPLLLGEGYAVLVNYSDQPAIAQQVQNTLNDAVGLAVYQRQPYLLAVQTTDAQVATQALQALSSGRFTAFIVDSSDVVLLSPAIALPDSE
ncbi:MAG: hypothetical protein ACFB0C_19235 [Leptolyngbyaceae cyanobacterium]